MLTYTGIDKESFVKEIIWHRKQDAVTQGTYGEQNGHWKGCAVACSLRSYARLKGLPLQESYAQHADFETYGIWPEWLARLEDQIFEHLSHEESQTWPERLAKAVPVGVNLDRVKWQFASFLLKENLDRVLSLNISDALKKQIVGAIRQVLTVHTDALESGEWNESAARSAAWSAAESAARSAAWSAESAARSAARSAAWSAESAARFAAESAAASAELAAASAAWSAARSAAWSAARSAAWSAAWSAAYTRYSNELLKLLKKAGETNAN